jgi:hypothetical protein
MFTPIDNLPEGAVGFEVHGRVTGAERREVLEPTLKWAIEASGKVRLLYVTGEDFDGYEGGELYDEAVFGSRNFAAFERIAFVADDGPYARSVAALDGLMPAHLRVFPTGEVSAAKAWLADAE